MAAIRALAHSIMRGAGTKQAYGPGEVFAFLVRGPFDTVFHSDNSLFIEIKGSQGVVLGGCTVAKHAPLRATPCDPFVLINSELLHRTRCRRVLAREKGTPLGPICAFRARSAHDRVR